jgi:hypothetical protein
MFIVDKVVDEDRSSVSPPSSSSPNSTLESESTPQGQITLPNAQTITLPPCALDAYNIFLDLCLLANGEKPTFLRLESLHKTFALELVESVLTNYSELFRKVCFLFLPLLFLIIIIIIKIAAPRTSPPPPPPPLSPPPQIPLRATHIPPHTPLYARRLSVVEAV